MGVRGLNGETWKKKFSFCCHVGRSSLQTEVFPATVVDTSELLFSPFVLPESICVFYYNLKAY